MICSKFCFVCREDSESTPFVNADYHLDIFAKFGSFQNDFSAKSRILCLAKFMFEAPSKVSGNNKVG